MIVQIPNTGIEFSPDEDEGLLPAPARAIVYHVPGYKPMKIKIVPQRLRKRGTERREGRGREEQEEEEKNE